MAESFAVDAADVIVPHEVGISSLLVIWWRLRFHLLYSWL
jgi:hypothetical protein